MNLLVYRHWACFVHFSVLSLNNPIRYKAPWFPFAKMRNWGSHITWKCISPAAAAAAAKSLQSCPTLCDLIDGSPLGSPIPGILQARTLEWVAMSLSNAWEWKVKVKSLSRVWLLATPWTAAYQAPLSMGFSRQEYWSGLRLSSLWLCKDALMIFLWIYIGCCTRNFFQ